MNIIARNSYTYKPSELQKKNYAPVKSSFVSVYEGSLVDEEHIPDNAVVIIELPKHKQISPQQALINADYDLRQIVTFAKNSEEIVKVKPSRTSNKIFVTIKTDENELATTNSLMLLERTLREIEDLKDRRVYMDRLESDKYDIGKSILTLNEITASYYEKKSTLDKIFNDVEREKLSEKEK